jgi:hypothetical protein
MGLWAIATVGVLVDTREDVRLIYVSSGEEESCTNDTRIQQVGKQGGTGDFQGSRVGGTSDPSENRVILRHKLQEIDQTTATVSQNSSTHHNVMFHRSPKTHVIAKDQLPGAVGHILGCENSG